MRTRTSSGSGDAGPAAVLGTQVEEAAEGAPDDEARGDDDHLADRDAHGDEYDRDGEHDPDGAGPVAYGAIPVAVGRGTRQARVRALHPHLRAGLRAVLQIVRHLLLLSGEKGGALTP